jgi:hypothetical protein
MAIYHLRLNMKNGSYVKWERDGDDMEDTLAAAKVEAGVKLNQTWTGGIAICGEQGDSGTFNF